MPPKSEESGLVEIRRENEGVLWWLSAAVALVVFCVAQLLRLKRAVVVLVVVGLIVVYSFSEPEPVGGSEHILRTCLSHVDESPGVEWLEVEGNNVYIGFSTLAEDWETVTLNAAAYCAMATDSECRVWAVSADREGWRPGDGPFYGVATVRDRQVVDFTRP